MAADQDPISVTITAAGKGRNLPYNKIAKKGDKVSLESGMAKWFVARRWATFTDGREADNIMTSGGGARQK